MKTLILPGFFFGDIAYHLAIVKVEKVIVDLHENYIKQSQRNHTLIQGPNTSIKLTLPIHKFNSKDRSTGNVRISHQEDFVRSHLQSIKTAYSPAPYFDSFYPLIEELYRNEWYNLKEAHQSSCQLIFDLLGVTKKIEYSEHYIEENDQYLDFRLKNIPINSNIKAYNKVFNHGNTSNVGTSIIDLIFNEGKWARKYLIDNSH